MLRVHPVKVFSLRLAARTFRPLHLAVYGTKQNSVPLQLTGPHRLTALPQDVTVNIPDLPGGVALTAVSVTKVPERLPIHGNSQGHGRGKGSLSDSLRCISYLQGLVVANTRPCHVAVFYPVPSHHQFLPPTSITRTRQILTQTPGPGLSEPRAPPAFMAARGARGAISPWQRVRSPPGSRPLPAARHPV